jgi:hypothetical protein
MKSLAGVLARVTDEVTAEDKPSGMTIVLTTCAVDGDTVNYK